jgi:N-acyl homoserine lactone hydrolase
MGVRVHAIQTGTVVIKETQRRARGLYPARFLKTLTSGDWTEPLPILAWVVEHPEGLIVVDTGEASAAASPGYWPSWHPYYRYAVRVQVEPEDEIGPQLQRLHISAADVRWVVLTHLHTDHAGGLRHFPKSEFLVSRGEHHAATGVGAASTATSPIAGRRGSRRGWSTSARGRSDRSRIPSL